jgi:FKBP-type peptidyl-prolyl cis-trans isomerase
MKKTILATMILAAALFAACKTDVKKTDAAKAPAVDPSYAFGMAIGTSLKETSVEIDYNEFLKGVKDVMGNKKTSVTMDEAQNIIRNAIETAMAKKGEENLAKETEFFAENGKKKGIVTTASGLQYEVIAEGTGANPAASDTVKVHYVGTLVDGTKFDSSIDRNEPAVFPLDRVIPGWTEGIQLMKVGGKAKFYIPSKLAYGANGAGDKIGPNSTLIFEVELLEINPKQ